MSNDIEDAISLLEKHICTKEVSFDEALDIIVQQENWSTYIADLNPSVHDIANLLTFDNSNTVVHALVTSNPEAARALYNELSYWADNNQI